MAKVALFRWPREAEEGDHRIKSRNPVMWIVETGSAPPECLDPLEDWIRPPVNRAELEVRIACLIERANLARTPIITEDNIVICQEQRLPLTDSEATIVRELVDNFRKLVPRNRLMWAGWGDEMSANRNALDLRILRLRRRLAAMGLRIVTVWGKGYILEVV
jgi:ompR family regulator